MELRCHASYALGKYFDLKGVVFNRVNSGRTSLASDTPRYNCLGEGDNCLQVATFNTADSTA